jgi:hypothetical protein
MVKPRGYEILLDITPNGKRKSAVISSNAIIKKMTFDCIQIEDILNVYLRVTSNSNKKWLQPYKPIFFDFLFKMTKNLLLILHTDNRRRKQAYHLTLGGIFSEFILHEMDGIVIQ